MRERAHPQANLAALAIRIQPQRAELTTARSHFATVRRRLVTSFDISKIVPIGSHARQTAIRFYSDLDVMVVLRRNEAKRGGDLVYSSTILGRVRNDLQDRYVRTDIRRDGQAVVLDFSGRQRSLDVVPALFLRFDRGSPVFVIPDGSDSWLEAAPEAHNRYFAAAVNRSGGKLRRVIQFLKWWKHSRTAAIPIQSFHLDLLLAQTNICVGVKSYSQCLYEAFKLLVERECRGFRDPLGIAGVVNAAQTNAQWQQINDAVDFALAHARAALVAEKSKDYREANRQWDIVFNGAF